MREKKMHVELSKIEFGRNVRLPELYGVEELAADISENGLKEPLVLWDRGDSKFENLQGHRRQRAIQHIFANDLKRFTELFGPEGKIPAIVKSDMTREEALMEIVDHGNKRQISDPFELQMCANLLFEAGCTEEQVAVKLASVMDLISPMKPESRNELDELIIKRNQATDAGAKERLDSEVRKFILAYRRGLVQNLHNAYRCPQVVMDALYRKSTGKNPDGVTDELPSKLTTAMVTKLFDAFKQDMKIMDSTGVPVHSKEKPGPSFKAKFAEYLKAEKEAAGKPVEPRAKGMSAKEMEEQVTTGRWASRGFKILTMQHAGKTVDVAELSEQDRRYRLVDVLFELGQPDEIKAFEELTGGLKKIEASAKA